MSLDLAWDKLDASLAERLVEILNKHLATVSRPSFIGPVEVTGIDFGTVCPDIEVVDMRDIYRDFLEDDEDDALDSASQVPLKGSEGVGAGAAAAQSFGAAEEDDYEWVSRRETQRAYTQEAPAYHHLPPHLRYGRPPSSEILAALPGIHSSRDLWGGGAMSMNMGMGMGMGMSTPNPTNFRPGLAPLQGMPGMGMAASMYAMRTPSNPLSTSSPAGQYDRSFDTSPEVQTPPDAPRAEASAGANAPSPAPAPSGHPNLQLHLRIPHHSDLRLALTTSLLINYPSPMFMALPIKLAVTGFVFDGEVVVAYEGQRRRVHFCVLDDLDPYGPAGERPKRGSEASSPVDPDDGPPARPAKPLPVGQRLLPSIIIESEIGQADKHLLKNVTRVERFIQDVIRETIEDELVFPNFHTLILGD
ncbi:hypothetical protein M0805_005533 [Coniferiporia weirii]|nr:hypothetical protein M0805_005533 [Coniferiporia weirii]